MTEQQLAERWVKEKQALVNVIQRRIKWLELEMQQIADPEEKSCLRRLLDEDEDTIEQVRELHQRRERFYERRKSVPSFPAINYGD